MPQTTVKSNNGNDVKLLVLENVTKITIHNEVNANTIHVSEIYGSGKVHDIISTVDFIYLFICMIFLLISGILSWVLLNNCDMYNECDTQNSSTCNNQTIPHPMLETYVLNPDAQVFITPKVKEFCLNISAPPFFPSRYYSFALNPSAVAFLPNNLSVKLGQDAIPTTVLLEDSKLSENSLHEIPIVCDISTPALSELDLSDNDTHTLFVCNNNREGSNTIENLDRTFLSQKYISEEFVDKTDINHQEVSQVLKKIRIKNINRVIIGHLNVNFFAAKLDAIKTIIPGNVDIVVFGETKLDASYPMAQLLIDGFGKPFRLDRNAFGGGILIYVRSDIPCKQVSKHEFSESIEGIFVEINFRK